MISLDTIAPHELNLNLIGGKAMALARMHHSGLLVPQGFVVTSSFFTQKDPFTQQNISRIHCLFDAHCPSELAVVRSSAVAEDSASRSYAGQFDSYLNVSKDHLIDAIQACRQSRNNQRVSAYTNGETQKMAVIVQDMITPDVSGVAFSIDPVSRDRDIIVIEAVHGHNEQLLQGTVTPDCYRVRKDLAVIKKMLVANSQTLSDEDIVRVARLAAEARRLFDTEVDIEWAITQNTLYILQCRPITTL